MKRHKILVTGAGGAASLGFCRSLNDADTPYELIGVDCDRYHLSLAEVHHRYLAPPYTDPDYLDVFNYIIEQHGVEFLHSQPDLEIEFLSEHREQIKTLTNFPSKDAVATCIDKFQSYNKWQREGIKVPRTLFIRDRADLHDAFLELGTPLWIRNIKGAGGKGSLPTSDFLEAAAWIDFCEGWGHFTAAECLTKRTTTWTSIWDKGELVVAQTRERLYWEYSNNSFSGVTGLTGTGVTVDDEAVTDVAVASILAIDPVPNGIFSVDMTYDSRGVPNPTEINIARFFTTHYFFTCAGVNFPDIFVRLSLGLPVRRLDKKINPLLEGLTWTRGMDTRPLLASLPHFWQFGRELEDIREQLKK